MTKISKDFKLSTRERRFRTFSESYRQEKVREIVEKRATISEVCRANEITRTTIYKWIDLYSNQEKPIRTIVESKSDTAKILALQKRIAELERLVGQKQVQIEFQKKMIEIAEETYKVDIKKKLGDKL
jgi:transposase-like protein